MEIQSNELIPEGVVLGIVENVLVRDQLVIVVRTEGEQLASLAFPGVEPKEELKRLTAELLDPDRRERSKKPPFRWLQLGKRRRKFEWDALRGCPVVFKLVHLQSWEQQEDGSYRRIVRMECRGELKRHTSGKKVVKTIKLEDYSELQKGLPEGSILPAGSSPSRLAPVALGQIQNDPFLQANTDAGGTAA